MTTNDAGSFSLSRPPSRAGRIGLGLSLVAPALIALMFLLRPGWGSPLAVLGGLAILFMPPAALIVSIVGWVRGDNRTAAIAGVLINIAVLLIFFVLPVLVSICL